jgi:thymidylate synthase
MEIKAKGFAESYAKIRGILLSQGNLVAPRGLETLEVTNVTVVFSNPRSRLGYHSKRKFALPFAIAEACLLFSNTNDVKYISEFNKRILRFSDDGKILYGTYGHRIAKYIPIIKQKLEEDSNTRQAVLQIYDSQDLMAVTKDTPCTNHIQFLLRNGKLDLFVTMRSNDFFWGYPYDTFQFTVLQEVMANELKVEVGKYIHRVSSFHIYTATHMQMLSYIKRMEEIDFTLPYSFSDMYRLANIVKTIQENNTFNETPFDQVLQQFITHKRENMIPVNEKTAWAKRFLSKGK